MGLTFSKTTMVQFFYDAVIFTGAGIPGFIFLLYKGTNTDAFKLISVCGLTMCSLLYVISMNKLESASSDKVIFITGCDSGLGYSFASHMCDLGFTVIAGCLNSESGGAKRLRSKYTSKIFIIELDLTIDTSINNAVNMIQTFFEINKTCRFWALINNAGIMIFAEFEWLTSTLIKQQINVNFMGTVTLTNALLPLIRKHSGRIITISSHCAHATLPGLAIYGATKAALAAWNDGLRIEQKKYGVNVISFIPGSFVAHSNIMANHTKHVQEMIAGMDNEQFSFYEEYFQRYNFYLRALAVKRKPKKINCPSLYYTFNHSLMDKYPSAVYIHESLKYKFYHLLFKFAPYAIRDRIIEHFIQMPQWNQNRIK